MVTFHDSIVNELLQQDGLVIMAGGLGLHKVLAKLLRMHVSTTNDRVVLILSTTDEQRQGLREEIEEQDALQKPEEKELVAPMLKDVDNQFTSNDRVNLYKAGGCLFVTSRILIVDLLNERVPCNQVAGIIVVNAHRVTETCAEAFILRLFRAQNKTGYIRAFSDRSQSFTSGFNKVERTMRSLYVKKLYLWPRFQLQVSAELERNPPEVIDIRLPFTPAMAAIQEAVVEVIDACLKELRRSKQLDVTDLTVEEGLFKSFDETIRRQLDPIWHTVSRKTKQIVLDLKTLRKLVDFLLRYDAVTFLKYLDTLRASEGIRSFWLFAEPSHRIFEMAKKRVYQVVRSTIPAPQERSSLPPSKEPPSGTSSLPCPKSPLSRTSSVPLPKSPRSGTSSVPPPKSPRSGTPSVPPPKSPPSGTSSVPPRRSPPSNVVPPKSPPSNVLPPKSPPKRKGAQNLSPKSPKKRKLSRNEAGEGDAVGVELEVVLEEMPKWKMLREVLEEIQEERDRELLGGGEDPPLLSTNTPPNANGQLQPTVSTELSAAIDKVHVSQNATEKSSGNEGFIEQLGDLGLENGGGRRGGKERVVLVAAKDERTCLQLQLCILRGGAAVMQAEWDSYLLSKADLHRLRSRKKKPPLLTPPPPPAWLPAPPPSLPLQPQGGSFQGNKKLSY